MHDSQVAGLLSQFGLAAHHQTFAIDMVCKCSSISQGPVVNFERLTQWQYVPAHVRFNALR